MIEVDIEHSDGSAFWAFWHLHSTGSGAMTIHGPLERISSLKRR